MTNNIKAEIFSFVFALLVFFVALNFVNKYFSPLISNDLNYNSLSRGEDYVNLNGGIVDSNSMSRRVFSSLVSDEVTLFASSELTGSFALNQSEFIPYKFFNNNSGNHLFAFGRAHAQSMTVLAQLASLDVEQVKENARIVLIFSPAWLRTDGTNIEAFMDFMPERLLGRLFFASEAPEYVKNHISNYVRGNFSSISDPSFIYKFVNDYEDYSSCFNDLNILCKGYIAKITQYYIYELTQTLLYGAIDYPLPASELNWDGFSDIEWGDLLNRAEEKHLKLSSNNKWGVENGYFEQYLKQVSNNGRDKITVPIPIWDQDQPGLYWAQHRYQSREYEDLKLLLDYLTDFKHPPLVVMQDLNPLVYADYEKMNFSMQRIKELVLSYGYHYADIWSYSANNYHIGNLNDTMHFGDRGWLLVNKAILDSFFGSSE